MSALPKLRMTDSVIQSSTVLETLQTSPWADCKVYRNSPAYIYCVSMSHYRKLIESPETTFVKNLVQLSFKTDTSSWSDLSWLLRLATLLNLQLAVQSELVKTLACCSI